MAPPKGYSDTYDDKYISQVDYLRDYKPNPVDTTAASTPSNIAELLAHADPAQALIDLMSWATKPTNMFRFDEASGSTDIMGVGNLVDVSSPSKQVDASTAFGTGALSTSFTLSSTESCDAADNAVADCASESLAGIMLCRYHTTTAVIRQFYGKRDAVNAGHELRSAATNQLRFDIENGVGAGKTHAIAIDHGLVNPQTILFRNDQSNDVSGVYSREGSTTGTAQSGNLTNTSLLTAGQEGSSAAGIEVLLLVFWIGTGGEGLGETQRLALAQALGLE